MANEIANMQPEIQPKESIESRITTMRGRQVMLDRFLIIDGTVYHVGASMKDIGKRLFAFTKMAMSKDFIISQL